MPGRWPGGASGEPLSRRVRLIVLAAVIATHAGGGWALTRIEPAKLVVGDVAAIDVRMVSAEQPAAAQPEAQAPPQPEPPDPEVPLAEPPPPPEVPVTDLASVVDPPPPDLPPPAFPVAAKPPPPEMPKPPPPKPVQPRRPPAQPATAAPTTTQSSSAPAAAATAPRTVSASQLGFLVPPNPVYPARSRRAGEQGVATVRVLVDVAGRPAQVSLQGSSGHAALDESALTAVRAAQFRPYADGGLVQPVWVLVPIRFVLQ